MQAYRLLVEVAPHRYETHSLHEGGPEEAEAHLTELEDKPHRWAVEMINDSAVVIDPKPIRRRKK
jgi:hypothetical protein